MIESCASGRLMSGQITRQRRQLLLDRRGRHAGGQQLGQPPGGGDFLKIEVGQPPHLADRHDPAAALPAANHRDAHAQQLGQHGRRVQPMDVLLALDQAQPLPELGFADDLERAAIDRLAHLCRQSVFRRAVGQRQLLLRPPPAAWPRRRAARAPCRRAGAPTAVPRVSTCPPVFRPAPRWPCKVPRPSERCRECSEVWSSCLAPSREADGQAMCVLSARASRRL